jgi:hypothetical protein
MVNGQWSMVNDEWSMFNMNPPRQGLRRASALKLWRRRLKLQRHTTADKSAVGKLLEDL